MQTLSVKTDRRTQLVEVTAPVQKVVASSGVARGICYLYVPHTTAAITINECADPDVARDVEGTFDRLIPVAGPYCHSEGNSKSPLKGGLLGAGQIIQLAGGKAWAGPWPGGFFFWFFVSPRRR